MNKKKTIIEVIGHECSQRDRQVYVASVTGGCSQRKPRMKGRVGELGKLTHPSYILGPLSILFQMPVTQAIRHA